MTLNNKTENLTVLTLKLHHHFYHLQKPAFMAFSEIYIIFLKQNVAHLMEILNE